MPTLYFSMSLSPYLIYSSMENGNEPALQTDVWLDDPFMSPPSNTHVLECLDPPVECGQNLRFASNRQNMAKVMKCHFRDHITWDRNVFLAHRLSLFLASVMWAAPCRGPHGKELRAALTNSQPVPKPPFSPSSRNWILPTTTRVCGQMLLQSSLETRPQPLLIP